MKPNPSLRTTGQATFAAISQHEPLLQVKAGVPLDAALNQAGLLMDLVNTLAQAVAIGSEDNTRTSNLALTISLLSDMAYNILADVESPVRQLCQSQGEQP